MAVALTLACSSLTAFSHQPINCCGCLVRACAYVPACTCVCVWVGGWMVGQPGERVGGGVRLEEPATARMHGQERGSKGQAGRCWAAPRRCTASALACAPHACAEARASHASTGTGAYIRTHAFLPPSLPPSPCLPASAQVAADPLEQFDSWFREATAAGLREPNAMALATADTAGAPSVRYVLLKVGRERAMGGPRGSRTAQDVALPPAGCRACDSIILLGGRHKRRGGPCEMRRSVLRGAPAAPGPAVRSRGG